MAKLLPIITYPNKILRKSCDNINTIDNKIQKLTSDMKYTMQEKDGIGLAAPQIGQNINLIVINTKDGPIEMINPKITKKSWKKEVADEGCLSIPDFFGPVKRSQKINVIYIDSHNVRHKITAEGLLARVIQHEVDHLKGILFIDYLPKKTWANILPEKK